MTVFTMILVVASFASIVVISFKRCEWFSIWTPLFIFVPSLAWAVLIMIGEIGNTQDLLFIISFDNFSNSAQRLTFSLEYLRSAFTVPLYFDQQEKLET